jgi:hypothetical protein
MTRKRILKLAVVLFAITSLGVARAYAATPAVSPATDPADGFPLWYQDANGVRLEACLDANDPNCVVFADPGFNPANPLVFPTNFPGEFFYFVADSDKITTPGCPAAGFPPLAQGAFVRVAAEGTFLNGTPVPGEQIVFGRIRISVRPNGLCPNTQYTFTHPYGAVVMTTDSGGGIPKNQGTEDIGCFAVPCNFSLPLASRVFNGFLKWDPAIAPAAPAGYLGDAATLHPVAGGPNNIFSISSAAGVVAQTNLFTVSGKMAGPLLASPSMIDFGGQEVGTTSAIRTMALTNLDPANLTISSISAGGADGLDFALDPASDLCSGRTLAQDQICTVGLTFTPSAATRRNAQLSVAHNLVRSPLILNLTGTGTPPAAAPVASLSPIILSFGNQRVRTTSTAKTVTLSNTGNAPLGANVSIGGPGASQFVISADNCSGQFIDAGASCTVNVKFAPTVAADFVASLDFTDNAANSPQTVALSGKGTGGLAAISSTLDPYGYPDWYQDENGVQTVPCLDAADPNCVVLADAGFIPALPLVFPTNFPGEFFYSVVDSDKVATPGCPSDGVAPDIAFVRMAVEGTFVNGAPVAGDQIVFGRIRITVKGGLCKNTTYAFTHPYGTELLTTNGAGAIPPNAGTEDIGCLAAPCDFNLALSSRVFGGFLQWDPAVAPAAPAGYLGDAVTLHPIVGSPYLPPGGTGPANYFRISDPLTDAVIAETNLFTVSAELAGPIMVSPRPLDFGPQQVGTSSVAQTLTVSNSDALNPVNINSVSIGGPNGTDFALAANTCSGPLASGASCTVDVAFAPGHVGQLVGVVSISHAGLNNPVQVPLSGIGIPVNQAPIAANDGAAVSPGSLANQIPVLANDSDPDGNLPLTIADFTQPANGRVVVEPNQNMSYTPNAGFSGTDTFTYQVADSLGALSNVATVTITVNPFDATATSISAPAVTFPANAAVTVTVSSAAGTPTGSVSLTVDGATTLSQGLDAAGHAVFTLSGLGVGSHSLSASYAAQANFGASSATGSLVVNPAPTSININAPTITFNANGSVTVTVSSVAGTPGGNVSLSVDGGAATSRALVNGSTTFTLTSPAAGTHTLLASYAAQGNFAASSAAGTLTVNRAATTTTINAPPVTFPANAFVTVAVTSPAGVVSGSVSLIVDGALPITQPLANGSTTFTVFSPSVGAHTLVASYAAQGNFNSSGATGTLSVNSPTVNENITATAQASLGKVRNTTVASWTINGTSSILTAHTMTVTLTRTGALIGSATTDNRGRWKVSASKSAIVPVAGDTITVTSSLGKTQTFPVTVK